MRLEPRGRPRGTGAVWARGRKHDPARSRADWLVRGGETVTIDPKIVCLEHYMPRTKPILPGAFQRLQPDR